MDTPLQNNTMPSPEESHGSTGAIVGSVIIVILLIAGGVYFFMQKTAAGSSAQAILEGEDPVAQQMESQGTSDEVSSIEADLNATDLSGLDAEVSSIGQ